MSKSIATCYIAGCCEAAASRAAFGLFSKNLFQLENELQLEARNQNNSYLIKIHLTDNHVPLNQNKIRDACYISITGNS